MPALRGVVRGMKLCLAGLNSIRSGTYELLKDIPFILESFYYIQDYQLPLIKTAELFLLDSGAFTFMSNCKKAVDWDDYLNRYIDFINKNDVKYFFELDIDDVVGYERVKELRRKLEAGTGRKCIPVWHKSRGIDEYKKHVAEYDYIAIGGLASIDIKPSEYPQLKALAQYAKKHNTKLHCLGFTPRDVHTFGFYSTDSTTWNGISRFGSIFKFSDGKITRYHTKNKKVNKEKYIEGEVHNIKEWMKYQEWLRRF